MPLLSKLRHAFASRPDASTPNTGLKIAAGILTSDNDQGMTLIHASAGKVFVCNRTGARMWRAISQGMNEGAISSLIGAEYGIDLDRAHRDTLSFVAELELQGFVSRSKERNQ